MPQFFNNTFNCIGNKKVGKGCSVLNITVYALHAKSPASRAL
jgi:hypothetical protein